MVRILRRCLIFFVLAVMVGVGVSEFSLRYLRNATRDYHASELRELPAYPVAVVFGASVRSDGSLSSVLKDRVDASVELYANKKVQKVLMTGDNGSVDYDEVSAMKRHAVASGIPADDVVLDYAGFNTYDSCYRAKQIFGIDKAILVTQRFHQSRAIYACRYMGIEAVGYDLPDFEKYPELYTRTRGREMLAAVKLLWQTHVTRPEPKYLGKKEYITP